MARPRAQRRRLRPEALLKLLAEHAVDFVVVGGLAGQAHGSSYPTFDLDIVYSRDPENLERLAGVLRELGATLRGAPPDLPFLLDAKTLEAGANFTFETRYGDFDILGDAEGAPSYEQLRAEAKEAPIEGVVVRIASIDHLIRMKRAADRPKDRAFLTEYIALAEEQRDLEQPPE